MSFYFSGHGENAVGPSEFRNDLFAKDLDQFIKRINLSAPAIFGHSMGGNAALCHKANYED